MANLEDARSHAYQNKISSLTEDDFARSQANRTRQSLETHHIAQRRTQDLQDEADQDAIANAPWVNEGIEAESQVISTVQTLSPPIHLASDFKEYQVTPHCTRRVYLAANQPKKLQIPPRCCHDCFGGDGKFPCNRCKARAATSQREVTCRVPCPFGSGILVWTFVRPVQTLKEAVQSNVLFAKIPGSKQGKRRSPVATGSQQIFAEYQTSVLLKPLSLSPPKVIMQNESFDGLLALAEILDVGDVRDTTRSYLPFFDNGCQAWKVANFESPVAPEKPTFWILDPCSSHHDSPVSAKAAVLDIQRLFSKFTYLFCEQSLLGFPDSCDSRGLLAVEAFIAAELLQDTQSLCLLNANISRRLCSAATCALNIERGAPNKPMRASANPEDVLSELSGRIAMNSSEGLETCRWLLRDSERVVNGLHRVYNLIQSAMTLRGVSTTITAQSRLKAIYNIRSLFQRDLPKYEWASKSARALTS